MNTSRFFTLFLTLLSSPIISYCAASSSSAAATPNHTASTPAYAAHKSPFNRCIGIIRTPTNQEIEQAYQKGNVKLLHAWMDTGNPELRARVTESAHSILEPEFITPYFTNEELRTFYTLAQDLKALNPKPLPVLRRAHVDLARMAKNWYLQRGEVPDKLKPHFEGVSIQNFIKHKKLPKIKRNRSEHLVLDLRRQELNSLDGLGNVKGIEEVQILQLQKNKFIHIEQAHLTKLTSIRKIYFGANQTLTEKSKRILHSKCK